ncbi:MAG: hypothetical protein IJ617_06240 [Oscillospiraceae bacterium]|nr:hypothetical protein [Oscillospiraceae bacterium]
MKRTEAKRASRGAALVLALVLALNAGALPVWGAEGCYPRCAASCESLVDALWSVGVDASFAHRKAIAQRNEISDYRGTAAQNIRLLNLLKAGALRRAAEDGGTVAPLETNPGKVQFIRQENKTCKATSVAMAVNLLRGNNACTTAGMGGSCCYSIEGVAYTGSDGRRYVGTYKTDSYVGSADELAGAVTAALATGVPIVAAVHSTACGTKHHWVVVVGRSGTDYLVVDPVYGSAGAVSDNTVTLSSRGYAFGLTDTAVPHYGYVTFTAG